LYVTLEQDIPKREVVNECPHVHCCSSLLTSSFYVCGVHVMLGAEVAQGMQHAKMEWNRDIPRRGVNRTGGGELKGKQTTRE